MKKGANTTIKFYQLGKKNGEHLETWNYYVHIQRIGEIDTHKLALMVGRTLHGITELIVNSGVKTAFSPSKPMWFEVKNGDRIIDYKDLNTAKSGVTTGMNLMIKGKKGKNLVTKTEMIQRVELAFGTGDFLDKLSRASIYKKVEDK